MTSNYSSLIDFYNKIPQFEQGTKEWLEQRKPKLTSSDIATALGLNPNKKAIELLFEKCGQAKQFLYNEATLHGQKYESEAIDLYCKLMSKKKHTYGMISYTDVNPIRNFTGHDNCTYKRSLKNFHDNLHFIGGSPDGIAEDIHGNEELIMLEVKCPLRRKLNHGEIPVYYYPQVQFNMLILDLNVADYVEYIPKSETRNLEFNIVRTYRNNKWLSEQIPKLIDFWNQVQYWKTQDLTTHPEYLSIYGPKKTRPSKSLGDGVYLFIEDNENNDENTFKSSPFDFNTPMFD